MRSPLGVLAFAIGITFSPLALSVVVTGCSDDAHEDTHVAGLEDVVYEGGATDEGLNALIGAPTKTGKTVAFTAPAGGTSVKNGAATFALTWGALADANPLRDSHAPAFRTVRRAPAAVEALPSFLATSAHAHGAAMFGNGYYLQFTRDGKSILSVFTTNASYTPTVSAWAKLGTGNVSVTLTAALFDNNNVARDGGPYVSAPVLFTVTP